MNILVLGIGNVLLMDEGVGVRAINELERRYRFSSEIELLDGGTAGIELLRHISGRDYLIIIDVVKSGQSPGTVVRFEGEDVPAVFRNRISPHQLGLSDLLAAAMLTDELPADIVLFGVEPASLDQGLDLSDTVEGSMNKLLQGVCDELESLGCKVETLDRTFSDKARFWDTCEGYCLTT